jgi:DNA topoisomerase IB
MKASQVIDWVKAPKTIAQMKTQACHATYVPTCKPLACRLNNTEGVSISIYVASKMILVLIEDFCC